MDDGASRDESPWWVPPEDNRRAVAAELRAELAPGHPLHGRSTEITSRCGACDEVLVRVGEDDFGLVHLTWSGKPEPPPYPLYRHVGRADGTAAALNAHAAEHGFE